MCHKIVFWGLFVIITAKNINSTSNEDLSVSINDEIAKVTPILPQNENFSDIESNSSNAVRASTFNSSVETFIVPIAKPLKDIQIISPSHKRFARYLDQNDIHGGRWDDSGRHIKIMLDFQPVQDETDPYYKDSVYDDDYEIKNVNGLVEDKSLEIEIEKNSNPVTRSRSESQERKRCAKRCDQNVSARRNNNPQELSPKNVDDEQNAVITCKDCKIIQPLNQQSESKNTESDDTNSTNVEDKKFQTILQELINELRKAKKSNRTSIRETLSKNEDKNIDDKLSNRSSEETMVVKFKNTKGAKIMDMLNSSPENTFVNGKWVRKQILRNKANVPSQQPTYLQPQDVENIGSTVEYSSKTDENNPLTPTTGSMDDTLVDSAVRADENDSTLNDNPSNMPMYYPETTISDADSGKQILHTGQNSNENERESSLYDYPNNDDMESVIINADSSSLEEDRSSLEHELEREYHENKFKNIVSSTTIKNFTEIKSNTYTSPNKHKIHNQKFLENIAKKLNSNKSSVNHNNKKPIDTIQKTKKKSENQNGRKPMLPDDLSVYENTENSENLAGTRIFDENFSTTSDEHNKPNNSATTNQTPTRNKNNSNNSKNTLPLSRSSEDIIEILKTLTNKSIQTTSSPIPLDTPEDSDKYLTMKIPRSSKLLLKSLSSPKLDEHLDRTSEENDEGNAVTEKSLVKNNKAKNKSIKTTLEPYKDEETKRNPKVLEILQRMKSLNGPLANLHLENESSEKSNGDSKAIKDLTSTSQKLLTKNKYNTQSTGKLSQLSLNEPIESIDEEQETIKNKKLSNPFLKSLQPFNTEELLDDNKKLGKTTTNQISPIEHKNSTKKLKIVNPTISNKLKSSENVTSKKPYKVNSNRLTPLASEPKLNNSDSAEENAVTNKTPIFVRKAPKILLKPLEKSALPTEVSKSKLKQKTNHNKRVNSNCSENGSCNKSEEENKDIAIKEIITKQKEITETVLTSSNKNRFDNKRRYLTETERGTYDNTKRNPTPSILKYSDRLNDKSSEIGRNSDNTDVAKKSHTTKKQFTSLPNVAQEKSPEDSSNTSEQKKQKLKTSTSLVLEKSSDIMSDDGKTNVYTTKDGRKQVNNGVLQNPQEENDDMTNKTQISQKTKPKTKINALSKSAPTLKLDAQLNKDPEEITRVNDYVTTEVPIKSKKLTKLPKKSLIKTMSITTTIPSQEEFAEKSYEHSNAKILRPLSKALSPSKLNIHSTSNHENDLKVNATKPSKINMKTLIASKKLSNKIATTTSPSPSSQETGEDTNEYLATTKLKLSSNSIYSSKPDLHLKQTDEDNTNVNDKSAMKKFTAVNPKIATPLLAHKVADNNGVYVPKKLLTKIKSKSEHLNLGIISTSNSEETPETNNDDVLKKNSNTNNLLSKRPLNKFLITTPIPFSRENPGDSVITKISKKSKPLSSSKLHSITMSAQPTQFIPEIDKYSDETTNDNNDYKTTKKMARNKKISNAELLQLNSQVLPNDVTEEIEIETTKKPPKMSILRSKSFQPFSVDKDPNDELVEDKSIYDTENNQPLISDSKNEELYIPEEPINMDSPNESYPDEISNYNYDAVVEENENAVTFEPESIDKPMISEENVNSSVKNVSKLKPKFISSAAAIRDRLQSYTSNKSKPTSQITLRNQNTKQKAEESRYNLKFKSSNTPNLITKSPTLSSNKLDSDEHAPYNEEDLTPIRFEELTKKSLLPNTNAREYWSASGNSGNGPRPYQPTPVLNHEDHYGYNQYNKNYWRGTKPNLESSQNEQSSNNHALESSLSSQILDDSMDNVQDSKKKLSCQSRLEVLPQVKVLNGVFKIPLVGRKVCDSENSGHISDIFVPVDKSNGQHSAISLTKLLTGDFRLVNGHNEHSLAMEPVSDNVDHSNMVQLPMDDSNSDSDKQAINSIAPRDIQSNKENNQEPIPPIHIIQIINNDLYLGTPNDTRQLPQSGRNDEDDLNRTRNSNLRLMLSKPQIRTYVHNGQNNEDLDNSYNYFDSEILDKVLNVYAPHMIKSREGYQISGENDVVPENPKESNAHDGHCPVCHVDPKTEHKADSSKIENEDDIEKHVRSEASSGCPVCHKKERETTLKEMPDQQETRVKMHQADTNQEIENEFDPNEKPIMSSRVKMLTDMLVAMKHLSSTQP
ncbi:putative mediator of RNA polymerase II transcription subunit 26 [Adelges cooleyi]|uniref:putative mediator of RNA polymerase II transcription subunit 26 n=1 Tax=Adelges cooleyi TaxID=133065 RepID=UPI00217FD920|nr:putative mediator of RNA polymerase II transcription subunit 26 [Adelges cooleyi]